MVGRNLPRNSQLSHPQEAERIQYEHALVQRVLRADARAADAFMEIASPALWATVVKIEGGGSNGREAFLEVVEKIREEGYRRLEGFNGHARLSTYLALVARELLAQRAARRLMEGRREAWPAFERIFEPEIRRGIARSFPRDATTSLRDDIYQEICVKLTDDDYKCLREYKGKGHFVRFVHTVIAHKLIDLVRPHLPEPRRRLPQAIARLPGLEQKIYAAIFWHDCAPEVDRLVAFLRKPNNAGPEAAAVRQALAHVSAAISIPARNSGKRVDFVSISEFESDGRDLGIADSAPTPEEALLQAEQEKEREAFIAFARVASVSLTPQERRYLEIVFDATEPLPPRGIATLMQCDVKEVYRLKQWAEAWLSAQIPEFEKSRACPSLVVA
jgi:RNA polymerase primary sigma factor